MSKLFNLNKEKWQGNFSYGDEYDLDYFTEVDFYIEIIKNIDSFEGIAEDEESKNHMDQPVLVTGFFQDDFISFVLKYPYSYFKNENGEIQIDRSNNHPEIVYSGIYDSLSKSYKGQWELINDVIESYEEGDLVEILSGSWELKKVMPA